MTQELARELLNLIIDDFDISQRATHIDVELEFCLALRMYASGGYQATVGHDNFTSMSPSAVSRIMDRFTQCLLNIVDRFIYFPKTRRKRQEISNG